MKEKTVNLGSKGSFKEKPGAFHRNMGIPAGKKITEDDIKRGEKSKSPTIRHEAASAAGFKAMDHSKGPSPFGRRASGPSPAPQSSAPDQDAGMPSDKKFKAKQVFGKRR